MFKKVKKIIIVVGFAGALTLTGCFASPDIRFVEAARATYKAIAPDYERYVNNDPNLDGEQKTDRTNLLSAWNARIIEAEKATKGG